METYEEILSEMENAYERESGHRPEDVSDTGLRLRVLAGELYRLRAELNWLERQAFPQTAAGEWLDRHGEQRGIYRREAQHARGTLTFSRYLPLSFDLIIPAGTVCAVPGDDPVEYETLEKGILHAGELSVSVSAQAAVGGVEGNAGAGYITTMTTPPSGINHVTNKAAFTGGSDRESDESYRSRVLAAYAALPNGTNAAYYRDIALSCDGVSAAGVKPRADGAGTVGVYIWGTGGPPEEETVNKLAEKYEKLREIGVTVNVQAATARTVNVGLRCALKPGAGFDMAKEAICQAVAAYFAGLSVGDPVYLGELEKAVLNAAPVKKMEFFASVREVDGSDSVIPVLGTVTVEELP